MVGDFFLDVILYTALYILGIVINPLRDQYYFILF
jgi:hypothetical protein